MNVKVCSSGACGIIAGMYLSCPHGYTEVSFTTVDDEGWTACCGDQYSVFTDDGTRYCKCCYATVL